jgi:hypothetical protein
MAVLMNQERISDRSHGVQFAKLRSFSEYWGTGDDRRMVEATLNPLPKSIAGIDALHRDAVPESGGAT